MAAGRRNSDVSAQDDFLCREFAPIDVRACIIIRAKRRAFEGNPSKKTTRARVAQNFRSHERIGIRRRIASYWTRCYGSIAAQLDFALENGLGAAVIHDQQDEISRLSADLESNATAFERHHCWGAPWSSKILARPANHRAAAVACADHERRLQNRREHDDALGLFNNLLRDVVWHIH